MLDIPEKYLTTENDLNLAGFIQGKVGYSLTDLNILTITTARNTDYSLAAKDVSERVQDLCWADALILYISKDSKQITDGGSTESETTSGYSKDESKEFAMSLYAKWEEDFIDPDNYVTDASNLW